MGGLRANVELSNYCHKAWCARRLAWFLTCFGLSVSVCEEMDMCNPPDLDMVAQAVLHWAGSCRQQLLHAGATVQNTYVQCFRTAPLGEESRPHPYLRAGLHIPHSLVLSMAWVRLNSHSLAGSKEWFGLRVAASDVQLWECTIFLWMTKPIYSFHAQLPLWLGRSDWYSAIRVDLHNCHLRRCGLSCAVVVFTGWH
jgi:hypothetical protein